MARKLPVAILLVVLLLTVIGVGMPRTVLAGGGVGGGGGVTGGSGGGPWGYTGYGHGWAKYGINSGGPRAHFHDGNLWPGIKSTCSKAGAGSVMVYVLGTGGDGGGSPTGKFMGYNYVGWSGTWGSGGSVDGGRATKVSVSTAHSYFNKLDSYDVSTAGYHWGVNVAWFCWDINLPKWGAMTADTTVNKTTVAPGGSVKWTHTVWDTGNVGNDKTDTINGDVYWGPGTSGPVPGSQRAGPASYPTIAQQSGGNVSFSSKFNKGKSNGKTIKYGFTVPASAKNGDKYCQYIKGSPTSSKDKSSFKSDGLCVKVVDTGNGPTGSISITCINPATHLLRITFKFADPDGTASNPVKGSIGSDASHRAAYVSTKTAASKSYSGTAGRTDSGGTTYNLYVLDVKPGGGNNGYQKVASKKSPPCAPGAGTETVTCSFYLTHTGTWEASSQSFDANYSAQVKSTRNPTSTTGSWSAWSGWSYAGNNSSRTRTRTQTATVVTYKVDPASFTSTWDGSNNLSSRTQTAASGNLSTPVPPPSTPSSSPNTMTTSSTFPYTWEDVAGHYTADGTFDYTVVKVTTVYKRTQTQRETGTYHPAYYTYTYDSSGNRVPHYHAAYYSAPYGGTTTSTSGWGVQSTTNANVASDTVDCDPTSAGQDQITFAYRPYLQVSGGDVLAGAYQKSIDDASCTSTAAGIYSWNHNRGAGSDSTAAYYHDSPLRDYGGAGTDAAAFALANIKYFSSAQHTTSGLAPAPIGLSFSNAGTSPNAGLYGTDFENLPTNCNFVPEFTGNLTGGFPAAGNASYSGNHTYVVHGNVTISGDIIYANNGGWSSPTDIPQLKLVVIGGNIIINGDVSELDGVYIATAANKYECHAGDSLVAPWGKTCQHRNADGSIDSYQSTTATAEPGGEIFTCQSTDYDTCNHQLTVYGSLVARKIHLRRTSGSLSAPGTAAAEQFFYSPEAWIPDQAGRTTLDYDSIVGLPPVL